MTENSDQSAGYNLLGFLLILFITLKLIGVIDWNWFWVLSPLLIPIILVIIIVPVVIMIYIIDNR